ncbi:hypothetical protein HMI55_004098 [Coelomomyces lativittatus]|nr:hypothetical protein HMI55_004098 [Coelomomyces lativittatus]
MEQLNPVPEILHLSSETLRFHGVQENVIQEINQMDQVIVNEYLADQGIMPHVDAPKLFGRVIVSLSLLSDCVMSFTFVKEPFQSYMVHLPKRSLLIMSEDARYLFKHGISKEITQSLSIGKTIHRAPRRVSLTYRKITLSPRDVSV